VLDDERDQLVRLYYDVYGNGQEGLMERFTHLEKAAEKFVRIGLLILGLSIGSGIFNWLESKAHGAQLEKIGKIVEAIAVK